MTYSVTFTPPLTTDDLKILAAMGAPATGTTPIPAPTTDYFPADPALAPFPSPENSQIMVTYPLTGQPTIGGRAYLKDKSGAVHTIILQGGIGVYCKSGTPVPGFGEPVAQCLVRQGEVYMQITSGIWKHIDPNGTMYNRPLPDAWTSTTPTGTPVPALPPMPVPSAIVPGSVTGKTILAGPTRALKTLSDAIPTAAAGDKILLDRATYTDTPPAWTVPLQIDLGGATFNATGKTGTLARGKALFCPAADSIIQNGTVTGVAMDQTTGQMTSAIRPDAGCGYLTIRNMKLTGNQTGVGQGGFPCVIQLDTVDISNNGLMNRVDGGLTHNLYLGPECRRLTLNSVVSNGTNEGHAIKYRGPEFIVNGGTFASAPGKPFDLPDGATVPFKITNAMVIKNANDADHGIMGFGEESGDRGLAGGAISGTIVANCQNPSIITTGGTIAVTSTITGNKITATGGGVVSGI